MHASSITARSPQLVKRPAMTERLLPSVLFIGLLLAGPLTGRLAAQVPPHRLEYRNPGLIVDLGVGLWAWPMPMDWDDDGDLDLVVSCPDVPYGGTYLFENPTTARTSDGRQPKELGNPWPVFKPPVRVGPKLRNATISYVDGKPRVLVPGHELTDFRHRHFQARKQIFPTDNVHSQKVRANQWRYVDYDNNGTLDLVVGVGDWTEYGWDNAFDEQGRWTRGPLHGYVYLLRNVGTTASPSYEKPQKIPADGKPIDVYGMPSPNLADFDGDGDLDLICGEFLDGFTYFQNRGTRSEPRYAAGRRLTNDGQAIAMDLQMIVPVAVDWDGDGDVDLIVGDEDGRVAWIEHTGKVDAGLPRFSPPRYFQQQAKHVKFGALVTPVSCDWDADGDEDLICGNTAGYIGWIENLDGGNPPRWAKPRYLIADGEIIRIQAGPNGSIQGPCEAKWGYTTLSVADWDHDQRLDIVANSIWGKVVWFRNVGTEGTPQLANAQPVRVAWTRQPPAKPAWNWWTPAAEELATQWRTTPYVIDLDHDGLRDLVMLDQQGYLAFFRRRQMGDRLVLSPPERLFYQQEAEKIGLLRLNDRLAGGSGRRKFCFADWDGDGRIDLLLNGPNVDLWRNVGTTERPWTFTLDGPIDTRRLAGHTTSPTTVDWDHNGRPVLPVGAEDGHLYYYPQAKQQ